MRDNPIVASAVDTRHSNASRPENSAKTPGQSPQADPKLNSVAHEVAVVATGARPAKTGERELFTEETTTVLVFENGGVLRLSAAVVPGQLLFLTNKGTRREVVAQVTRKRDFKPTSCYVEVEFSEPSPGFWGLDFPETPQLAPANVHQREAAELVRSAKIVSGKPSAPAPTVHEVTALKQEVEALREQLKLLQTQNAPAHSIPAANHPAPTNSSSPADASAPAAIPDPPGSTIANASNQPAPSLPISETPPSPPAIAPPAPVALPIEPGGSFSEALHAPKPVIRVNRATKSKETAGGSLHAKSLLITLLSAAALLAALGTAWYLHWIPGLPQSHEVSASEPPTPAAQPSPAPNTAPPMASNATNPVNSAPPTTVATPQLSAESKTAAQSAPKADAAQFAPTGNSPAPTALAKSEPPTSPDASMDPIAPLEGSAATPSVSKHSAPRGSLKTAASSAALPSQGAAIVPPRLIKSVRAIASPNALEYFAHDKTATVTLDAVVDANGRVKSMKVLSGPVALRDSAIEALKQYRYEPATLRGKPVAAHVTVAIKFLFEP
jgi:TonB family protein